MDKAAWKTQVRRLNGNFHDHPLRPETVVTWYDEGNLIEQPEWLVSLAVHRIIRRHEFPPRSVAKFLEVIEDVRGEMAREQAEDATRTCPGCCTEDVPGWHEAEGGWMPCPDCRPGRYEAFAETRKSGWPNSKTGRNVMAASFDKATGYPKGRETS